MITCNIGGDCGYYICEHFKYINSECTKKEVCLHQDDPELEERLAEWIANFKKRKI